MTESRLRDLMTDLVADVDAPPLARGAWDRARRIRRRRKAAATGTVL